MRIESEFKKIFEYIKSNTPEENLNEFKNYNPNNLTDYHFSLGLWLRNNITDYNEISKFFSELNINNKDDISHLLILLFWYYVQ